MKRNFVYIFTIIALIVISIILGYSLYKSNKETKLASENLYNNNFYELVNYVQNVEAYLAKSTISTSKTHGAETLTYLWREANLAQTYLSNLPIESQELEKTSKFLNQVSDYSYSLSRKNIEGEDLTDEDLTNLEELYTYSCELEDMLNQLLSEIETGIVSWDELKENESAEYSQAVSSNLDIFSSLEENFHEYSGLIYDGAFSEHLTSTMPKGLTGDEITEENAINKVKDIIGEENIKEITSIGLSENASIESYNFTVDKNDETSLTCAISKIGGHIVYINSSRIVESQNLSYEDANKKGLEYLSNLGFDNMQETYYLNQSGILTINYAYTQEEVIMYADLIKVKIALDDGEIIGIETTGYLNNHEQREINENLISINEAKASLNKNLDIQSEGLAMIPTEYKTEILCYEFKGKVEDTDFIVYINAENGEEEDILIVYDTPNGTLSM